MSLKTFPPRVSAYVVGAIVALNFVTPPKTASSQQSAQETFKPRMTFIRVTPDLMGWELIPGWSGSYKGASLRVNRWGMRDRDYDLKAAPGTFRVALLGSSMTMAAGVPEEETAEALLEKRLTAESGAGHRVEILNFSVSAYGVMNQVPVAQQRVFRFKPDVVLIVIHRLERGRTVKALVQMIRDGIPIENAQLSQLVRSVGAVRGMEPVELRRRLNPVADKIMVWAYSEIAKECRVHGVPIIGIVFPVPGEPTGAISDEAGSAQAAGIPLVSLDGAYAGYDINAITLANSQRADTHLNELGNKLVADRLYTLLRSRPEFAAHMRRASQ